MGVSPPLLWAHQKNAMPPEQVIRHHCDKRRGGIGGQALSPPSSYQCLVFHIIGTEILQSQINYAYLYGLLDLRHLAGSIRPDQISISLFSNGRFHLEQSPKERLLPEITFLSRSASSSFQKINNNDGVHSRKATCLSTFRLCHRGKDFCQNASKQQA